MFVFFRLPLILWILCLPNVVNVLMPLLYPEFHMFHMYVRFDKFDEKKTCTEMSMQLINNNNIDIRFGVYQLLELNRSFFHSKMHSKLFSVLSNFC